MAITISMFNFGNVLSKNVITFDLTKIERKKKISRRHEILLRIVNVKIARKKSTFSQNIFNKIAIFPKSADC